MKTRRQTFAIILAALASLTLACNSAAMGQVAEEEGASLAPQQSAFIQPVDLYATLSGLQAVVRGNPGTFLMQYRNLVMFAWPDQFNYSFAVFTRDGKPILDMLESIGCNGQKVDVFTMATFTRFLEGKGWEYIQPGQLPAAMLAALQSYAITAVATGTRALVTIPILFIPSTIYVVPTPRVVAQ